MPYYEFVYSNDDLDFFLNNNFPAVSESIYVGIIPISIENSSNSYRIYLISRGALLETTSLESNHPINILTEEHRFRIIASLEDRFPSLLSNNEPFDDEISEINEYATPMTVGYLSRSNTTPYSPTLSTINEEEEIEIRPESEEIVPDSPLSSPRLPTFRRNSF